MDKKIFVAVPAYDKKLFVQCTQSLMNAMQVMLLMDIKFEFKFEVGCPYVSMARNNLVRAFMASECTDLVFIDADLGFPATAFRDLISSEEAVVGGAYPKKQEHDEYAVRLATDDDFHVINENGALVAEALATGFLKIKREVFEQMQAAYPEKGYVDVNSGEYCYNFFGTYVENEKWYGDDYGFCHLWERLGGRMHVLPDITFLHAGKEGNFHQHLIKQSGYPIAVQKAMGIDGYMTPQELNWLYQAACNMSSVVELGSWKGKSTTALLGGCKGTVTAVDNWSGHDPSSNGVLERAVGRENVFGQFKQNTASYTNLAICQGDSADSAQLIDATDMVFIDAEHTYEGCKRDIEAWLPKTKKIIAGHDYSPEWPGVVQAVTEVIGPVNVVGSIWYKELAA